MRPARRRPSSTAKSLKGAEKRGASIDPRGGRYDAGKKKIKGKKHHVRVDTQGLVLRAVVRAAAVQDRDGGVLMMLTLFGLYSFRRKI